MVNAKYTESSYPAWWPKAGIPGAYTSTTTSAPGTTHTPPSAPAPSTAPPPPSAYVAPSTTLGPAVSDGLAVPGNLPLTALSSITTRSASGQVFRLDSTQLDAMRASLRRTESPSGVPGWQLELRIPSGARHAFAERLETLGASGQSFHFAAAEPKTSGGQTRNARTGNTWEVPSTFSHKLTSPGTTIPAGQALTLEGSGWKLQYIPRSGPEALRGLVRVEVTGDDATAGQALAAAVQKVGLQSALVPPTPNSTRMYAAMRLLKSTSPAAAQALVDQGLGKVSLDQVLIALETAGVSASRVDSLRYAEVAPGHFTVLDDARAQELRAQGLKYAFSTVELPEHVLSILKTGQLSSTTRWSNGQLVAGMSSWPDMGTGGAQGVFARLVSEQADGMPWVGRKYKVLLKPEIMARLDVWGWAQDEYGRSWGLTERNFGSKLLEDVNKGSYHQYNEVVLPVGNGPQWIAGVVATNETDRKILLNALAADGWTPSDGRTREQFVVLAPTINKALVV